MRIRKFLLNAVLFSSIGALVACSSDDSGTATTEISGSVFAAAVDGASLTVTDTAGNIVAGPVVTSSGAFSVNIPNSFLASNLVFESSGGTFTDEATGSSTTAGAMATYVPGGTLSNGATVHATPASTIIRHMVMQQTMSMTEAQAAFQNAFGYMPDHTIAPTDATNPGATADDAQKLAGLRAAIFSQLAADLGLTDLQSELCVALAQDLSDGELDGESAAGTVAVGGTNLTADIRHRYVMALMNFRNGNDNSGLNNAQIGQLPFARVALTASYRVEYKAGMMEAMAGKSTFTINVTDPDNAGAGVAGLTLTVMPMMYMAEHSHSTPKGSVVDLGGGDYKVTVYYLMPSIMNGESMGYWDLKFMVDGEEVHFNPPVMMAMGDTLQARLKGQTPDMIMSMTGGMEGRTYFIFNDGEASASTFDFFVATKDSMMSFPAVDVGTTLTSGTLTVTDITAEVSTDGSSFTAAVNNGSGSFSASGLNITDKIYVKLSVNIAGGGLQQKTTDGAVPDGGADPATTNEFATFMVTP